jgi:hypothetical protein
LTSSADFNTSLLPIPGKSRRGPRTVDGKARIAASARVSTAARWDQVRASGGTKLGSYSEDGLASLRAFNTGRLKSAKTKALIREKAIAREARKRLKRAEDLIAQHRPMTVSILNSGAERAGGETELCPQI